MSTPSNPEVESLVIRYKHDSAVDAVFILEIYADGKVEASTVDNMGDNFHNGITTMRKDEVDSLAKRLFENIRDLEHLTGGSNYDEEDMEVSVVYHGQTKYDRWIFPSDNIPPNINELLDELSMLHARVPKKKVD